MLTIISVAYLLWLAWSIASAPLAGAVGSDSEQRSLSTLGGFMLGFANPKAYLAFASLFGSFTIVAPGGDVRDGLAKWALCVLVMAIVALGWLLLGVWLGRLKLSAGAERMMNIAMGGTIVAACAATVL